MGYRIVSNDEMVQSLPTKREMGKFEQLIRRSPPPVPPTPRPTQPVKQAIAGRPVPVPKIPDIPEPVQSEPEYVPEYIPEELLEVPAEPQPAPVPILKKSVKSAFDLPFNPDMHGRGNYIPVHIPPAVTEPLVIPKNIAKPVPQPVPKPVVPVPVQPVRAVSPNIIAERQPIIAERVYEFPDTAAIYGRQPVPAAPARTTFQNTVSVPTSRMSLHLPKFESGLFLTFFIVRIVLGIAMVGFGIYTSGSYYGPAIGKFSGDLAMLFYRYQLGMVIAFAGMIVVYDALRFRIKK
jgi:hypothetical protein